MLHFYQPRKSCVNKTIAHFQKWRFEIWVITVKPDLMTTPNSDLLPTTTTTFLGPVLNFHSINDLWTTTTCLQRDLESDRCSLFWLYLQCDFKNGYHNMPNNFDGTNPISWNELLFALYEVLQLTISNPTLTDCQVINFTNLLAQSVKAQENKANLHCLGCYFWLL